MRLLGSLICCVLLIGCASQPAVTTSKLTPSTSTPASSATANPFDTTIQPVALKLEQSADVALLDGNGTIHLTFTRNVLEIGVEMQGLESQKKYEISLISESSGGALFDHSNAQLLHGQAEDETIFLPDSGGLLAVKASHPTRIVGSGRGMIVVREATAARTLIARSLPFTLDMASIPR